MIILKILGITVLILLAIGIIIATAVISKYLLIFNTKKCEYCGHRLTYKGAREDEDTEYYLFYCKHCGRWEKLSTEELMDDTL